MPQNTITDLSNHLFEQMERLNDDELSNEELELELRRSKAMVGVSSQLIDIFKVELDAVKFVSENGEDSLPLQLVYKHDNHNSI